MEKYSGQDDIYRALVDDKEESWLLGMVAFAVFEEQKVEWIRHRLRVTGARPTAEEARGWYEAQPPAAVIRAQAEAETALGLYGSKAVASLDEAHRREVAEGVVVAEVRRLRRWAPQLGMNVLGGFIGSMVYTAVLVALTVFVLNEPSVNDVARKLKLQVENHDGQSRNHP